MSQSTKEHEPAKVTDWIQALAALAAAVLAGWAVLVALDAFRDQQAINQSQLRLNQLAEDRFQQRYASRVAWWTPTFETVVIQNRSPVPLEPVDILMHSDGPNGGTFFRWRFELGMGPCTIATVRWDDLNFQDSKAYPVSIEFTDPAGQWKRDNQNGLTSATAPLTDQDGLLQNVTFKSTEDCGEAG